MVAEQHRMIAVDGPAASGKSTVARTLAKALAMRYINSGALYRAIALLFLRESIHPEDPTAVRSALDRTQIEIDEVGARYYLGGEEITSTLWTREVTQMASVVAKLSSVREKVNAELRRMAKGSECVIEGRDIGSVVFPEATFKVYLEASPEERARRRQKDFEAMGAGASLEEIGRELAERDQQDSTRAVAPLRPPEGAIVCNSTGMTPEQVVDHLLALIRGNPGWVETGRSKTGPSRIDGEGANGTDPKSGRSGR